MKSKGKSTLGWSELMFPESAGSISTSVTEILKWTSGRGLSCTYHWK